MDILIHGLEVYGKHGVAPEEKILGQRLLYDVRLTMNDCPAAETDQIDQTVDYAQVVDVLVSVATSASYALLERLAMVAARAILERFPVDEVWVKVTKPHPPVPRSLASVAAAVTVCRAEIVG